MNTAEIKYALQSLFSRKLRSGLTILSILIGVMAVFALISFGYGIQSYVNSLSAQAGVDKLIVRERGGSAPGLDKNFFLSKDMLDFIQKINGVSEIAGFYVQTPTVKFDKQTKYTILLAFDPKKRTLVEEATTEKLLKGRPLKESDTDKVVLGYSFTQPDKIFKKPLNLNDKLMVNDQIFEVVGFYAEVGNPSDDGEVFMTNSEVEKMFPDIKEKYAEFLIRSQPGVNPEDLAKTIQEKLRKHLGEKKDQESFYVQTFADAIATFSAVINIINGVLVLIAFVSIIVASVNIMNTMYTAVLERTNEIGIMKAIGARNSDILFIFVFESGMLGMIGGLAGITLGYLVASLGGLIAKQAGYALLQPIFPPLLIIGSLFFSFVLGAVSGWFPARQASRLKPVEALRYE